MKISKLLQKSSIKYLLVGGFSFAIDAGLLFILHEPLGLSVAIATSIAFWIGVIFNFTLTRYWTFSSREKSQLKKHIILYILLLGFNYLATVLLMLLLSNIMHVVVAKTIIVALQTIWNFPIYKYVIFKQN